MYTATIDATHALASALGEHWGDYGYSLAIEPTACGHALAYCRHADGSEWWLAADRNGNVVTTPRQPGAVWANHAAPTAFDSRDAAYAALITHLLGR